MVTKFYKSKHERKKKYMNKVITVLTCLLFFNSYIHCAEEDFATRRDELCQKILIIYNFSQKCNQINQNLLTTYQDECLKKLNTSSDKDMKKFYNSAQGQAIQKNRELSLLIANNTFLRLPENRDMVLLISANKSFATREEIKNLEEFVKRQESYLDQEMKKYKP